MTREQARREIDDLDYYLQHHTDDYSESSHTAIMMAISALEQEPCDDAISREWLMRRATERFYTTNYFNHISAMIEEAPPVTPSRRKGQWIVDLQTATEDFYICSECGRRIKVLYPYVTIDNLLDKYPYCHCGAKMEVKE